MDATVHLLDDHAVTFTAAADTYLARRDLAATTARAYSATFRRLGDLIGEAADGPTGDAALDALNLARPVVDGEHVHVPTPQEVADGLVAEPAGPTAGTDAGAAGAGGAGSAPSARDAEGHLDLNLSTPSELEELPGVGPVLAQRIVEWRDANGGSHAVGQLREVTGIDEQTFQDLADLVVVG